MIGRLKDTMETAVKAVSISNGVYSGIDVKKSSPKAAHSECGADGETRTLTPLGART